MIVELDKPGWFLDEREVLKGNRVKYTATAVDISASPDPNIPRWVWKTSKPSYPLEFWSEIIAAEIGAIVGIAVPPAWPATYQGTPGALMENFVNRERGEVLDHGGDLLLEAKPNYDRKKGKDHSVQLILQALTKWDLADGCYPELFRQWLYDAVIGNQDRHQDNWGLIVTLDPDGFHIVERVAPAFDNGSSLGRELTEERIADLLGSAERLERYIDRGQAHVRWEEDGNLLEVTQEDLIARHLKSYPEALAIANDFLSLDILAVAEGIRSVCHGSRLGGLLPISVEREEFIVSTVWRRVTRLQGLIE